MKFKINNKNIEPSGAVIGGTGLIETASFVLPGMRISGIPYIVYQNVVGSQGVTMLDWRNNADGAELIWKIGREATLFPGTLTAYIRINDAKTMAETYRTNLVEFEVEDTISEETPQTKIKVPEAPKLMRLATIAPRIQNPDEEPPIAVDERTITVPTELQTIAVQNDIRSETVKIKIPQFFDGEDLSQYSTILKCISDGGRSDIDLTDTMITDGEYMTFEWTLKPPETSYAGKLRIQIRCISGDTYKWETYYTAVTIAESLDADPVIPMDANWVDQALQQIAQYSKLANDNADRAEAAANSVSADAEAAMNAADEAKLAETNAKAASEHPPRIGANGNWEIYQNGQYSDTGMPSKGKDGADFRVLGFYTTLEALESAITAPNPGDAYGVGVEAPYEIYIYDSIHGWINNGTIQGAKGADGATFTPSVDEQGNLSWTNDQQKPNPETVNINGKSAYEIAVDNGFEGTEAEWIESIHGETGNSGVYMGDTEPTDPTVQVWINPNGDTDNCTYAQMQAYVDAVLLGIEGDSY